MVRGTGLHGRDGPQIAPGEPAAERESYSDVVLVGRLRMAIQKLKPVIPEEACEAVLS